jgi:tRNA(Ile)-lysidine synthase
MRRRFLAQLSALQIPAGDRALVAVSGGVDSVALLDLLARTGDSHCLELVVAHVDHGINPDSAAVAASVERLARSFGLRCITTHLNLGAAASETLARQARYSWLEETREREGARWIITAHHADDQVETVFLRFLHGSGPAGLAGMHSPRGNLLRPLLGFRRKDLQQYAAQAGLTWWEDPANRDTRHLRSWLRSEVLPLIRGHVSGVDDSVLEVAEQAAADRAAWDRVIDQLPGLDWRVENTGGSVAVAPFAGYDSTLGSAVLRALGRRLGCVLSRDHASRMVAWLEHPESGSRLEVGNGWRLEIVFNRAHLLATSSNVAASQGLDGLLVEGEAGDGELGRWRVNWRYDKTPPVQERDALTAWFIPQALQIRRWNAGDKVFPLGGRGRRLVVRCFQDAKVPRHLREEWPMVTEADGEIVWVPGICRSNRLVPQAGAEALRVDAQVV